ncbi:hypothetical protein SAMN05216480_10629 [Pustulibacterium marinum]|uniref:Uncharacterized protein n=1 Tax=Pustulibacterium marinum TaxID=1224947 RepID=A0A1I7GVZ0_9FLAO|nr:hypothetical protein [Pustulibacterium marinum]SFU52591.1 hypothetical protein SAMN05216480_10629 [Pustulibacterium marinum]
MKLNQGHKKVLSTIYKRKSEAMHRSEILKIGLTVYENPSQLLHELLSWDLIETEGDDTIFYLTPEAYDFIENGFPDSYFEDEIVEESSKTPVEVIQRMLFDSPKKFKRLAYITIFSLGILYGIYKILNP